MIRVPAVLALSMVIAAGAALAAAPSPYAGWQARGIKALSAQQIEDYLDGRGMGLALPAELNGYPGPRHVLDLAAELGLTADQLAQTERLFDDMRRTAVEIGERILAYEASLNELFASGNASDAAVSEITAAVGRLSGQLRAHHLSYHLAMRDLLDPHQVRAYQHLRGHGSQPSAARPHGHDRHGGHQP